MPEVLEVVVQSRNANGQPQQERVGSLVLGKGGCKLSLIRNLSAGEDITVMPPVRDVGGQTQYEYAG